MTTWLTDDPAKARLFPEVPIVWSTLERNGEDSRLRYLAALFNPDRPTWIGRSRGDDRCMVVIDTARASQMDAATAVWSRGEELPDRLVCLALTGRNFRGQRHRPWQARRGNLHLTASYHINRPLAELGAALTMLPVVAAVQAIERIAAPGIRPRIKWVNDVMVDDGKVCGVLTATRVAGAMVERAVFGIGLNIDEAPEIDPSPFVPRAVCLADLDPACRGALPRMLHAVVAALDAMVEVIRQQGPEPVLRLYRRHAGFMGEEVLIWPEGTADWRSTAPSRQGVVTGIGPDLGLLLSDVPTRPVRAGRMAYAEWARRFPG